MKRSVNTVCLTKDFIESKISQEAIMSKYLNIPIEDIKNCIDKGSLMYSVFRDDDTNKSMGFAYNKKGRLKVRDFGGFGFFEDVYGTVAYVLSLAYNRHIDCNNKQDFYFILKHIAKTFSKIIDGTETDYQLEEDIRLGASKSKNHQAIIEIVPRSWNYADKKYWNSMGVGLDYLNTHFVYPVDNYYIDRGVDSKPKYYYTEKDPCYAYLLGQNRRGILQMKLYFPLRDKHNGIKFITNCYVIEGIPNLELFNYDYIIITKSSKDRLAIGNALYHNSFYGGTGAPLNIGVVNLPSENHRLTQVEYDYLINKLSDDGKLISFLDFDRTGRLGANYLNEMYNIPYIFITRGEFGLINYGCKDFSELYIKYGKSKINEFIKNTLDYVRNKY